MSNQTQWILWCGVTLGLIGYLAWSLKTDSAVGARTFLPGKTTHGHYQIELKCNVCHTPGNGVTQQACLECHGAELKLVTDTHPPSKFADPGKAHLLRDLDARKCITCHQEHVPDRTLAIGLSLPKDYCWNCHQEIGEQRPSHAEFTYDSCATAGCHNYHDNRALFENYLASHFDEPDYISESTVFALHRPPSKSERLEVTDHDAPQEEALTQQLLDDWATSAHAEYGVNCSDCHQVEGKLWLEGLTTTACQDCHQLQVDGFFAGRHGMRLAVGLSAITPADARLPMHEASLHRELDCAACHDPHSVDTTYAAVSACLKCHADNHSRAYLDSPHYMLWQAELEGNAAVGSGVSCATCHLPRIEHSSGKIFVQHNQNDNLRPNVKMVRSVCNACHGIQFSLDALADQSLVETNFQSSPEHHVESLRMAKEWFDERERLKAERKKTNKAAVGK